MKILEDVLALYKLDARNFRINAIGTGLINNTWVVESDSEKYILQKINSAVFKDPFLIADNIDKIEQFLKTSNREYFFIPLMKTATGLSMVQINDDLYFRMFPFIPDSHTLDVVETPDQAFEAAKQFGQFTKVLSGIDINTLNITLPHFHDLSLRYNQFIEALQKGNTERIRETSALIDTLKKHVGIVEEYNNIIHNPGFKLRVTHHDTKISNVLFDKQGKGICVIDLDTVMPGYFISDMGDMMRTYLSPVSEEESDFSKIEIRDEFYNAIVEGYNYYMNDELTEVEKRYMLYSGKFMIYMQALRFLTDYLLDDVYYGARYEGHNYIRAQNQSILLQKLIEKETLIAS